MTTRALLVTSSILGDNGQSNALASHFQQQAAARDGVAVTHRDVVANALPHLAIEELGAWQTPADERTTEPQGLIEGKRAIILAARGGQYAGTEFDSQTPHLKTMLGLMGISDVEVVFAEGLNMGDAHRDAAMKEAFQAIDQLVEAL